MMDNAEYYVDTLASGADKKPCLSTALRLNRRNVFPWLFVLILLVYSVPLFMNSASTLNPESALWAAVTVGFVGYEVYQWFMVRRANNAKRKALYQKVSGLRRKNIR